MEELALPLTNSRGFGKFIRFDYKVDKILDMPLVISPHILNMGNPFYSRQALYFLEDVECVIKMIVDLPLTGLDNSDKQRKKKLNEFQRVADDCLFEYSLQNCTSRLTTRSDRRLLPQNTTEKVIRSSKDSDNRYVDVDNGNAGLLEGAESQFEDIYRHYSQLVSLQNDDMENVEEDSWWAHLSSVYSEPFKFYKTPYTFEELELISQIIPINPKLVTGNGLDGRAITREHYIGLFNREKFKLLDFPQDKWPKQEIIEVNTAYNPILLDFYFSGLSSLSPIIEFRNYYSVIEYFFEDATFSNLSHSLEELLTNLASSENFRDYTNKLEKIKLPFDEKSQLREVIKKYLHTNQIEVFFKNKISRITKEHFETYSEKVSGKQVQCIKLGNPNIQDLLADRIYQFRNAVFHAKRTRKGEKMLLFRPYTSEEDIIKHEALLLRFVAQEIIRGEDIDV